MRLQSLRGAKKKKEKERRTEDANCKVIDDKLILKTAFYFNVLAEH